MSAENMPHLLSISEAAGILHLSKYTLYRWASEKRIAAVKLGSRLFFDRSEILAFIDRSRVAVET